MQLGLSFFISSTATHGGSCGGGGGAQGATNHLYPHEPRRETQGGSGTESRQISTQNPQSRESWAGHTTWLTCFLHVIFTSEGNPPPPPHINAIIFLQ